MGGFLSIILFFLLQKNFTMIFNLTGQHWPDLSKYDNIRKKLMNLVRGTPASIALDLYCFPGKSGYAPCKRLRHIARPISIITT
jgi:hypothetical protein